MKNLLYLFISIIVLIAPICIFAATNPCWSVAISASPSPAYPGDTVTFTARLQVKFEGVTNLRVIGVVDGIRLYDNTFASLAAGSTRDISLIWTATLGDHRAYFQIDPEDTIAEVGTDNLTETRFTIVARPPVTPLNIYFSHNSVAPVREVSGEESFINYEIHIADPWESSFNVTVAFKVNGRQVDTETFTFTGPGLSGGRVGQFTWHTECGATVEVVIDPVNAIIETNEGDNSWIHPVVCVEPYRPNLIISQYLVSWTPRLFNAGDRVTINYTTNNIGEEATGAYKTGLKVGDRIVARTSHSGHPSGTTSTGSFSWTVDCSGPLSLFVDCDAEVIESNESDNGYQRDDFACSAPNLKASTLSCSHGSGDVPADTPYQYTFGFNLEGVSDLSNVRIRMGVAGGEVLSDETLPALGATRSVNTVKAFPAGSYTLYAVLDPENTIAESNETDNRIELSIRAVEDEAGDRRLPVPAVPAARNNYKISITNKKTLEKSTIRHSTNVWINGSLINTGNKSVAASNIPVRLVEENLTAHTSTVVFEETINMAPNAMHKLKMRWNPIQAGKMRLTLSINAPLRDAVPSDNKDEVIIKVQ